MKVDARFSLVHAHGPDVTDDVYFVSAIGQAHSEFGGDDAATTDHGVADDGDV